ncbi:MAG: DnaJ-like protein [Bacteroidetes bacterium]|nr:MAG: DnaJ-like protein [Bacteroidota bacterium]
MRAHYLKILGLGENSSTDDIRKAYRRLAKKFHPDVNKDPGAHAKFIAIAEAYDYLVNTPVHPKTNFSAKSSAYSSSASSAQSKKNEQQTAQEKMRRQYQAQMHEEEERRRQQQRSRIRAEQYAKMSFQEYRQSEYFRNTLRTILHAFLWWKFYIIFIPYCFLVFTFFNNKNYGPAIVLLAIPVAFVAWALLSRPGKND